MIVSTDPRMAVTLEDSFPMAEVFEWHEPEVIVLNRKVCLECGGCGCEDCK